MDADEKLVHRSRFVVAHRGGDIMVSFAGRSQASAGATSCSSPNFGKMACKRTVHATTTRAEWRSQKLPGAHRRGHDGAAGRLDIVLLSMLQTSSPAIWARFRLRL